MDFAGTLLAFAAATIVLVALPGPNLVYIVTRSVSQGRRAGIVSALGIETGTLVHVVAAVLGLSTVVAASPGALAALKWAGVAYLAYLAVEVLRGRSAMDTPGDAPAVSLARVYRSGVLVNVLNPKVILFFLAFLPQFATGTHQLLVLGVVFVVLAAAMDLGYALAGAGLRARLLATPRFLAVQRYLVVAVYFGLATFTAVN